MKKTYYYVYWDHYMGRGDVRDVTLSDDEIKIDGEYMMWNDHIIYENYIDAICMLSNRYCD